MRKKQQAELFLYMQSVVCIIFLSDLTDPMPGKSTCYNSKNKERNERWKTIQNQLYKNKNPSLSCIAVCCNRGLGPKSIPNTDVVCTNFNLRFGRNRRAATSLKFLNQTPNSHRQTKSKESVCESSLNSGLIVMRVR